MTTNYEKSFLKDIKKLQNKQVSQKLKLLLSEFEKSNDLTSFQNVKKLKGNDNFFRIKISEYRLGFHYENNEITIIRFLHRKDIYKFFP